MSIEICMNSPRKQNSQQIVTIEEDISPEDLKRDVLNFVAESHYDDAIAQLQKFLELDSPYPNYKKKCERFVRHCIDLIYAIKSKKNFPGYSMLTRSKQQEVMDKIKDHFEELQDGLSKINLILIQLKKEDLRSTLWIFRVAVYATWFLMIVALLTEISGGLYRVGFLVVEDLGDKILTWVFSLFP